MEARPLFWINALIFRLGIWWNSKASVACAVRAGRRMLRYMEPHGTGVHFSAILDRLEGKKPWNP